MGKKYEDEIREILKGFDDEPKAGSPRGASGPTGRKPTPPRAPFAGRPSTSRPSLPQWNLNPQRIMGFALILILFAWVMQGPWARGFPDVYRLAGYVSLAGTVLFVVALIAILRAGGRFGGGGLGPPEQRWRGQVIYLPNRQPFWIRWRQSLSRLFRRRA